MAKVSVEQVKQESAYLRGTLPDELALDTASFSEESKVLLKFHGIYQQEDRDSKKERKRLGQDLLYFFMVRSKIPGGKLTAEQFLAHADLCDEFGNKTFRLTTRQGIQLHGVFKNNLRPYLQALNAKMVSTLAACGDVERNVMSCPAPINGNPIRQQLQDFADELAGKLCPRTNSYHDVWLNGQKAAVAPSGEVEPIYGATYLPRKFKTAIALLEDNCVDALANDAAFLTHHDGRNIEGFTLVVGGGMGMTHGNEKTYPRLASPLCFVTREQAVDVLTAVIKVQRDHGNRAERNQARMKYLIDKWGMDRFRETVAEYYGKPLTPPRDCKFTGVDDHLGWHEQGDGKLWLGIPIVSGRVHDTDQAKIKTGLKSIVAKFKPAIRITAQQNVLLCDVDPKDRAEIDRMMVQYNIAPVDSYTNLLRWALACPAMPTCGLALADSERAMPGIVSAIHAEMASLGLTRENIALHMTGCPNGCARPYNSDIGVVGRSPGKYTVFLGGNIIGDALSFQYKDLVPEDQLAATLRGPLLYFKQARDGKEGFGDFCRRKGAAELHTFSEALST